MGKVTSMANAWQNEPYSAELGGNSVLVLILIYSFARNTNSCTVDSDRMIVVDRVIVYLYYLAI